MKRPAAFAIGDRVNIHIDRLAIGGRGVGRGNGLVIFVEGAAPDEDVEAEITSLKKNFAEATLVRVLASSPSRIVAPCPIADRCGGCSWQHISYDEQLKTKRLLVEESLRKFSGFTEFTVPPVIASPKTFRYRNRVQVHIDANALGFYARGTNQIIDAADCLIADEDLVKKFAELRPETGPGTQRVQVFKDLDGIVRVSGSDDDGVLAFSQVNTAQNENLVRYVVEVFRASPRFDAILDLYCGSGNFSFPLGRAFPTARINAVELNHQAVLAGQALAKVADTTQLRFFEARVESFLRQQKKSAGSRTAILLDPPRSGCGTDIMTEILAQQPTTIVYVSCHPVTLARDLQPLAAANWRLSSIQAFDMFPQTDHVETVAVLLPPRVKS